MARTAIALTYMPHNTGTAETTTALDPTNGHNLANFGKARRVLLHIKNTTASVKTVTVKAGAPAPAVRSGLGDLVVSLPANTGEVFVPLESARFAQVDGSYNIDVAASMTGTIAALQMP